ncbi:MAG TPA: AAA family ATPase [Verrucomicrobiae bacterium]|nr:AAA family ATPase [Verrucomicrobiae bacterium]
MLKTEAFAELKDEWLHHFDTATASPSVLAGIALPPCEAIAGSWLKQGDLGFICGPRGLGKTWWAMLLARKCAEGGTLGDWNIHKPRRVLYVDGEMSMDAIRERDEALSAAPAEGIYYLQHEALFHRTGKVMNLTEPQAQAALLEKCIRDRIEMLLLDNLSCLFPDLRENDADAWNLVLPWLLELRRHRIAVIFIAHCGRNGLMRGTSRREDAAFWIINLSELKEAGEDLNGAKFAAKFVKNRNTSDAECPPLEWRFTRAAGEAKAIVTWNRISMPDLFRKAVEDGLSGASDIAYEISASRGQVSKLATKAIKDGWLKKKGRLYVLASEQKGPTLFKNKPQLSILAGEKPKLSILQGR